MIAADHAFAGRILNLIPINNLDARLQEQVLAQGELLEFRKKKTVFEIGARDAYTFYLIDGQLELQAAESSPVRMRAGEENALRAFAQLQPRRYTAVTISAVSVFRIERAVLDNILADEQLLEESGADIDVHELEDDEEDDRDWMSRLLSSELFTRLPHENIQRFFTELLPLEAEKDEIVVEQGTPGDFLYIVAEGLCVVVRRAPGGGQETQLAVLKEGDTFGEESLISNSPRNASVRMASDGMLMRLPKAAFQELVSNPTLKVVPWSEASKLAEDGAIWLDVRFADEHKTDGIEGSINAPLNSLRQQATNLDRDSRYILYCDSGARSSTGAFLMARLGFDACYLAGGLDRSPLGTTPKAAPAETIDDKAEDIAAAASSAFEFEFVTAEDEDEDEDEDKADGVDEDGGTAAAEAVAVAPAAPAPAAEIAEPVTPPSKDAPAAAAGPVSRAAATGADEHPQMARARAAVIALRAERDKTAAFAKKAADAARELKRRNDELNKLVLAERDRREQLDKALAAAKADTERQASMEQTRLSGELAKTAKRVETLQLERDQARKQAIDEVARVHAKLDESERRATATMKEKEQADAKRTAAEAAFEDSLQHARSEAEAAQELVKGTETELGAAHKRIIEFETRDREQAEQLLTETSRIKLSLTKDQIRVEEERERLEHEREQLNIDVEQMRKDSEAAHARVREARAAIEKGLGAARTRDEALQQREAELDDARESIEQTLRQRDEALAGRDAELADREQALSNEKALWQETVDKAISDERKRLQSEQLRFREKTEALTEQRVQALLEEKTQELVATHEEREAQMRGQVEAHVAKLLAEFDTRLESVRSGYETRLNEQEVMLEDERRRLEAEIARLLSALTDARQTPAPIERTATPEPVIGLPLPAPQTPDAPALDFQLNEQAAAAIQNEESRGQADFVPTAADLELDIEIDETQAEPGTPIPPLGMVEAKSELPVLEITESIAAHSTSRPVANEKRDRVISSDQLAEIRARMQEKMRAAKSRAG